MENFRLLCNQLYSSNPNEILQAQHQINELIQSFPITQRADFLIKELETDCPLYSKFISMILLSQIELSENDHKKILRTIFLYLTTDNVSLRNIAINLFAKSLINIINISKEETNNDFYFSIINQITEQISNLNSNESQTILYQSIINILFILLENYHDDTTISLYISSYLYQQMIELPQDEIIKKNCIIQFFSDHISFLFQTFLNDERAISFFTFLKTILEDPNYKNSAYLIIFKITEFNYRLLIPIIDTFFQISQIDLNQEGINHLTILNTLYSIFKNEQKSFHFQSSLEIASNGFMNVLIRIMNTAEIREMRFEAEWNESIASYRCLKKFSKSLPLITTPFLMDYLVKSNLNDISLLLVEIIVTSSPHDFVVENISNFLGLVNQGLNHSANFIQFTSIKCLRKIAKHFSECFNIFFPFSERLLPFIEKDEFFALESFSALTSIFCIAPYEEKVKYINLLFQNSINMPPFISSHSIDSLLPIISTIEESGVFIEMIPTVLKMISEVKDELFLDSLLYFLQKFVLDAGESISPFIQTIISMLIQIIIERHSTVAILAIGSISFVSLPEIFEPFVNDVFNILTQIILTEGMTNKSVRNQCLSSLSLIASHFNLSLFMNGIFEVTIKIIENIKLNEWNDFDFCSSAFLIDLYIPLIKNQNEIDNSILSHIFNIILHQISLIDFKVDEENSKFSEISFFLETSNKFMTLIFIYCQRILNEDVFNLSFLLIDKATQLPLIKISVKETIYDLYAVLIQKFPSQLCALFSQNRRIESFILNMISSNEFMNILSNKAIRVHQK